MKNKILLALDPGASQTKSVYSLSSLSSQSLPQLMLMESEVFRVSTVVINDLKIDYGKAEDRVWISTKKKSKEIYALGLLAKDFQARNQLNALKYESALYKILGIVGAIAHKHQLSNPFDLELLVLLPFNEFTSRQWLEESLKECLPTFYWCGKEVNVTLSKFQCLPEGYGGVSFLLRSFGEQWLQNRRVAVLMFGHRNTSFLRFERGSFQEGRVSNLGFYQLLQKIVDRSAGQDVESLLPIIYRLGNDLHVDSPLVRFLLKSKEVKHRKLEAKQLVKTIVTSRQEYWRLLEDWLKSVVPRSLHEIIILGGGAQYFRLELSDRYSWTNIHWCDNLAEEIIAQFNLSKTVEEQNILCYRLIDIYSYFYS